MPRFAANLSMLYPELAFLDRFDAASKDGFTGVEYLFPYAFDASEIKSRLEHNGLKQVLFNASPGGTDRASISAAWDNGDRGVACIPGREHEFKAGVALAIEYALALDCPRIHAMAGLVPENTTRAAVRDTYIANLKYAAAQAANHGLDVLIEPINRRDMPTFFLNHQDDAHALIAQIGAPNVKVQFDLYHCQIVEGDVAMKIKQYLPTGRVGHFQIAGVPERHEPDIGEMNYPYLFKIIDETAQACGWDGWVGCEYRPSRGAVAGGTSAGLGWMQNR